MKTRETNLVRKTGRQRGGARVRSEVEGCLSDEEFPYGSVADLDTAFVSTNYLVGIWTPYRLASRVCGGSKCEGHNYAR